MKQSILLPSICLLLLTAFSSMAQQPQITDSVTIEQTALVPSFNNYNFIYKQRLDSIQKMIPLPYNEFVQKYIDLYSGSKERIGKLLGLSSYYFPIFEQALNSCNIPDELKYIPVIESSMDPMAVSHSGATGLWQFMYTTAKGYRLNIDNFVDERKDPVTASYAAAAYFRDAYEQLDDWLLAIAAYNCGTGCVTRAIAKADSRDFWVIRPFLPVEAQNYVPAFIAMVYIMKCAECHDIELKKCALTMESDTLLVNRFVSLPLLARALEIEEQTLCAMNPGYKKKIVNGTPELPRRIIMPKAGIANFAMVFDVLNNQVTEVGTRVVQTANDEKHRKLKTTAKVNSKRSSAGPSKKYLSYKSAPSSHGDSGKL